jgi:hypothetical protein
MIKPSRRLAPFRLVMHVAKPNSSRLHLSSLAEITRSLPGHLGLTMLPQLPGRAGRPRFVSSCGILPFVSTGWMGSGPWPRDKIKVSELGQKRRPRRDCLRFKQWAGVIARA